MSVVIQKMSYIVIIFSIFACGSATEWDYFTFTESWPPTFCQYNRCSYPRDIVRGWNIHGLWPSSSTGEDPFNCYPAPPFNIDNLKSIYDTLIKEWADVKDYDDPSSFWKHEWSKHGTCSLSDPLFQNELGYFNNSLTIKYRIALDKIFADNNIVPSGETRYNTQTISNAIRSSIHVTPKLECVKMEDDWYLSAIEICLNKDLKYIECPRRRKTSEKSPMDSLVHQSFDNLKKYLLKNYEKASYPVNTICGDHEFYLLTSSSK